MHGVLQGMTASVKYLLKRGADTSIPEKDGYTPMHGAGLVLNTRSFIMSLFSLRVR